MTTVTKSLSLVHLVLSAFLAEATRETVQVNPVASEETKHIIVVFRLRMSEVTIVEAGRFRDLDFCHLIILARIILIGVTTVVGWRSEVTWSRQEVASSNLHSPDADVAPVDLSPRVHNSLERGSRADVVCRCRCQYPQAKKRSSSIQ